MKNQPSFFELSPDELSTLASLVAIGISKGLNVQEISSLGNFITAVGTLMTTISAQIELLTVQKEEQQKEVQTDDVQKQIKELKEQMQKILNEK